MPSLLWKIAAIFFVIEYNALIYVENSRYLFVIDYNSLIFVEDSRYLFYYIIEGPHFYGR